MAKIDSQKDTTEEFVELAARYAELGRREGIKIVPFISNELPHFHQASAELKKTGLDFLRVLIAIQEEENDGTSSRANFKTLLWRALTRLSLSPPAEIFDRIKKDDIVVILAPNGSALFWNLEFCRFTSFTIEELLFTSWQQAAIRPKEVQQKMLEVFIQIFSGKSGGYFDPEIPVHIIEEISHNECHRIRIRTPWVGPLHAHGSVAAMLVVHNMELLQA